MNNIVKTLHSVNNNIPAVERPQHIKSKEAAWKYINETIDWSFMYEAITVEEKNTVFQPLVDIETADLALLQYKRFLYLRYIYPEEHFSPSVDMDLFWHLHILDTIAYTRDCYALFDSYVHHFPYFGIRDDKDAENLNLTFENTQILYTNTFGESL